MKQRIALSLTLASGLLFTQSSGAEPLAEPLGADAWLTNGWPDETDVGEQPPFESGTIADPPTQSSITDDELLLVANGVAELYDICEDSQAFNYTLGRECSKAVVAVGLEFLTPSSSFVYTSRDEKTDDELFKLTLIGIYETSLEPSIPDGDYQEALKKLASFLSDTSDKVKKRSEDLLKKFLAGEKTKAATRAYLESLVKEEGDKALTKEQKDSLKKLLDSVK